jgi:hypothetical protein
MVTSPSRTPLTDLTRAVRTAYGLPLKAPIARLHALGFTPEDFDGLTALAKHARAVDAVLLDPMAKGMPSQARDVANRGLLAFTLVRLATTLRNRRVALDWLQMFASLGPEAVAMAEKHQMCPAKPLSATKALLWTRLVGPRAPFAWAAGYPLLWAALTRRGLHRTRLATIAYLHGIRLPDFDFPGDGFTYPIDD